MAFPSLVDNKDAVPHIMHIIWYKLTKRWYKDRENLVTLMRGKKLNLLIH